MWGEAIKAAAQPLSGRRTDLDDLVNLAKDSRFVLIGEATHGTREFYDLRAELTRRLIVEHEFNAVALEADWADAAQLSAWVTGHVKGRVDQALSGFERFPTWMWRNASMSTFAEWLCDYNRGRAKRVGIYGLDLYGLGRSMLEVLAYLDKVDPQRALVARERYACLQQFGDDPYAYGYATAINLEASCEKEVVAQLAELAAKRARYLSRDGEHARVAFFDAQENAHVVRAAEEYYRASFRGGVSGWNLRDTHMADTLGRLAMHLAPGKIVVWAHNSHVGDARASQMRDSGEVNLGQLARQRFIGQVSIIGQSTYRGTVIAASRWDGAGEKRSVRPALDNSFEVEMHAIGMSACSVRFSDVKSDPTTRMLTRCIGVVYRPETERLSHYLWAQWARMFDAMVHIDGTSAVVPIGGFVEATEQPRDASPLQG